MKEIEREIVGAFIVSSDQQILLGKGQVFADAWLVPGGGREEGESTLTAMKRETLEESGLDLDAIDGVEISLLSEDLTASSQKVPLDGTEPYMVHMRFCDYLVKLPGKATDYKIEANSDWTSPTWFKLEELATLKVSSGMRVEFGRLGWL